MNTNDSKLGWAMVLAGVVLLGVTGKMSLLLVLVPAAVVLAFGIFWAGRKTHGVTHGLK